MSATTPSARSVSSSVDEYPFCPLPSTLQVDHEGFSQLMSALRAANDKLDKLETERSGLKKQLADVVSDSGAHAARMRYLEKQVQAARKQKENKLANDLSAAMQKNEALRKSLSLLSGDLQERDGQIVQLELARDAALKAEDRLRHDLGVLHHGMQDLEESLRQTQARNADLVAQLGTLEGALRDSQAKNNALLLQMEEAKNKTFKEEAKNNIFKQSAQSTESAGSAERKAEEASCKPPRDASGESSTKAHSQQPDMNPADETCSRASSGDSKYVRREVLEQVKKKAKADLAELENELMTVVLTMESDCARQAQDQQVATPTLLQTPPEVTGWSRPAASLLTAGWQIGEQQERIQLLEMDKEMLIIELKSLAAKNAELVKTKYMLDQQLVHLQQSQRPTAMLEPDEDRDRELREEGAREVSNAADDQIQFLLQAGSLEISSLKSQVNILMDQLQRVVGSKNASLALNSNTPSGGCVIFPANSSPPPIAGGRISLQAEGARERGRESSRSSSCSSSGKHAGSFPAGSIDGFSCQQVLGEEADWLQEMEEGEKAHAETGEALQLHGNCTHTNSENLGAPQDSGRSITDSKGKVQHKVSNSVGQLCL
jgi:myosin heavy subunit